jgi:DnaJ-class molecular chaperone
MDFNQACLNLQINSPFSSVELKKQYRIMALKYHPDKHMPDTDHFYENKFKAIGESYEYLNNHAERRGDKKCHTNSGDYNSLFSDFLSSLFTTNQSDIQSIIQTIISDCENISMKLFENMDKERAIQIFEFINTYQHILYVTSETVERIKKIINDKIEHDHVIILNPNLEDLLNDNIFILDFEGEKYYVPLWHDEIYYKHKTHDLVVKCIPELPEDISLDDNNNIIVNVNRHISSVFNDGNIICSVGNKKYTLYANKMNIQGLQKYVIKGEGISLIQSNDVYDNAMKSDIIFIIRLT